jgi:hypothetical protein
MGNGKPQARGSEPESYFIFAPRRIPVSPPFNPLYLTMVGAMPGRRENTEQTEVAEQTENPKEIPSIPFFPFVPYSLIPFMIDIPRLCAELPNSVAFVIYALS